MSRAFVKEQDTVEELPDRLISEHANLVTPEGLKQIEAATARDLRYWSARAASAELVAPTSVEDGRVHFGSTVTIERSSGRRQTFRIVGEDEAEPAKGTIPYVAPLARALWGKEVGDVIRFGEDEIEVLAVD